MSRNWPLLSKKPVMLEQLICRQPRWAPSLDEPSRAAHTGVFPPPLRGRVREGGGREPRTRVQSAQLSTQHVAGSRTLGRLKASANRQRANPVRRAPPSLSRPHKGGGNPQTTDRARIPSATEQHRDTAQ